MSSKGLLASPAFEVRRLGRGTRRPFASALLPAAAPSTGANRAKIVAVVWLVIAGVLFSMGRKKLSDVNPKPERTVESLRDVADTLKGNS